MRLGVLCALALAVSAAVSVQAGSITAKEGMIAVRAQQVPLGQLLAELGGLVPLEVVAVDPGLPSRLVDVQLDDVPLDQAAGSILLETNCAFIVGGLKGQPLRVILGSSDPKYLARAAAAPGGSASAASGGPEGASVASAEATAGRIEQMRRDRAEQAQAREAELQAASDAQREAEQVPIAVWDDPKVEGGYSMVGDSVTYHDPNFVPYKNRPEVRARRMAADVSTIP